MKIKQPQTIAILLAAIAFVLMACVVIWTSLDIERINKRLINKDAAIMPPGLGNILDSTLDEWEDLAGKNPHTYRTNFIGSRYSPVLTNGYYVGVMIRPTDNENLFQLIAYAHTNLQKAIEGAYVFNAEATKERLVFLEH